MQHCRTKLSTPWKATSSYISLIAFIYPLKICCVVEDKKLLSIYIVQLIHLHICILAYIFKTKIQLFTCFQCCQHDRELDTSDPHCPSTSECSSSSINRSLSQNATSCISTRPSFLASNRGTYITTHDSPRDHAFLIAEILSNQCGEHNSHVLDTCFSFDYVVQPVVSSLPCSKVGKESHMILTFNRVLKCDNIMLQCNILWCRP